MVSYASAVFVGPVFLFQVWLLTRQGDALRRTAVLRHLVLPAFAVVATMTFLLVPVELRQAIDVTGLFEERPDYLILHVMVLLALEPVVYLQWLVYAALVFLAQRRHAAQLKHVFASTEKYELFWVIGIAGVLALYALGCLLSFVNRTFGIGLLVHPVLDSATVLLFVVLLTARGLRQAPGLHAKQRAATLSADTDQTVAKYSRSALASEHAKRIARKLHYAMQTETLYRDPNLSLTKLSQHIGSSSNYVSQTLNEHINQSFFDFVNWWRIEEAKSTVLNADVSIRDTVYAVGFNSRSAFYTAFKKHTGQTPSKFRSQADLSSCEVTSSTRPLGRIAST
ncbi:hypothetical protein GCM10007385_39520 [Tateyamaria omphalii]|nr:hypothetical protein GCM10007385_39520 [Tateyamaria omphalii]